MIVLSSFLLLVALIIFVVEFVRSKCTNLVAFGLAVWVLALLVPSVIRIG